MKSSAVAHDHMSSMPLTGASASSASGPNAHTSSELTDNPNQPSKNESNEKDLLTEHSKETLSTDNAHSAAPSSKMEDQKGSLENKDSRESEKVLLEAERITAFTDAVVAIAMTLLILPLMEAATDIDEGEEQITVHEFFGKYSPIFQGFAISFWLVTEFWIEHLRLFVYVGDFTFALIVINLMWLAGIVFLPVASSLLYAAPDDDLGKYGLYIGVLIAIKCCGATMSVIVYVDEQTRRHEYKSKGPGILMLISHALTVFFLVIALIITLSFPQVHNMSLLIVLLNRPILFVIRKAKPDLAK